MKIGNFKIFILLLVLFFTTSVFAEDKIETVPLINLEELSPTFEEDKDELEKKEDKNANLNKIEKDSSLSKLSKNDKIYINLTALDKITAKTSSIKLSIGEKKFFGPLEIKVLKCVLSSKEDPPDTIAYLQIKDLSEKNKDQVFIFNGWTFASTPTLKSVDHPVYDVWLVGCENV